MERYTEKTETGAYCIKKDTLTEGKEGFLGPAAKRLAAFERVYEQMKKEYKKAENEMESLKKNGRTNSATFRQLMAKKVNLKNMMDLFEIYGIQ